MLLWLPKKWAETALAVLLALLINLGLLLFIQLLTQSDTSWQANQVINLSVTYKMPERQDEQVEPEQLQELTAQRQSLSPPPASVLNITTLDAVADIALPDIRFTPDQPDKLVSSFSMDYSPDGLYSGSRMAVNMVTAKPVYQTPVRYPARAKSLGLEGHVTMLLSINTEGLVEQTKIQSEDPVGVFTQSARRAVMHWRFSPPDQTEWQKITIYYELDD
ncbi:TonB family protein [Endozoicomonas gorgoniicola]|uniref:Protein TonB n=1 Tax=Endozoicomonas gorgoniicola TaxID=1234144 RepID=A0ABT3MSV0_9GAMM|nr:energy transducer TonB [Endozoicomonas gorgoniicola]MCW7552455.1 TonB family protein [Endozoicomonas gorgoniicola]